MGKKKNKKHLRNKVVSIDSKAQEAEVEKVEFKNEATIKFAENVGEKYDEAINSTLTAKVVNPILKVCRVILTALVGTVLWGMTISMIASLATSSAASMLKNSGVFSSVVTSQVATGMVIAGSWYLLDKVKLYQRVYTIVSKVVRLYVPKNKGDNK